MEADEESIRLLARAAAGPAAVVERVEVTALQGGFVAKSVERLDLTLSAVDRPSFVASFVCKRCPAREVWTLEAIAAVPDADAAPELIAASVCPDAPDDPEASWFVSPFYPGETLHFGDPIPAPRC
jgi:hypothetical protein